jgi:hypothetical protein
MIYTIHHLDMNLLISLSAKLPMHWTGYNLNIYSILVTCCDCILSSRTLDQNQISINIYFYFYKEKKNGSLMCL